MEDLPNIQRENRSEAQRKNTSKAFSWICLVVSSLAIVVLTTLLASIFVTGGFSIDYQFLTGTHHENDPDLSGIGQAIVGTVVICVICAMAALPIGVGTAIFLEEFQPRNKVLRMFHGLVQLNINNLAGVPSVVYGILGLTAFVYMFGVFNSVKVNDQPDIEIGATYYYQLKTLGGDYVKFPAEKKIQDTLEIKKPVRANNNQSQNFLLNVVTVDTDERRYANRRSQTVLLGALAELKTVDGQQIYSLDAVDGTEITFAAFPTYATFAKVLKPIEVTNARGETFMLNVLSKEDSIPDDETLKTQSVFADSPDPNRRSSASIFFEPSPWHFHLPFAQSILSAGLTLALVILPIVIIASQEAIRGVPQTLREAAFGMGATRWQVVRGAVLPSAIPGIMTGAILAMSRAVGEAAPILVVMGGVLGTTTGLRSLMDNTPALPVTIYKWAGDENQGFENLSAAAIIILLVFLLMMNSVAIYIRYRHEKKLS